MKRRARTTVLSLWVFLLLAIGAVPWSSAQVAGIFRSARFVGQKVFALPSRILSAANLKPLSADTVAPVCVPPPAGIVSWWRGEGNAFDVIGGNDGTLQNGVSFAAGEVGQDFSFDGTTNGQGVDLGNPSNLQLQDFTIDCWLQRTSTTVGGNGPSNEGGIVAYGHNGYGLGVASDGQLFLT